MQLTTYYKREADLKRELTNQHYWLLKLETSQQSLDPVIHKEMSKICEDWIEAGKHVEDWIERARSCFVEGMNDAFNRRPGQAMEYRRRYLKDGIDLANYMQIMYSIGYNAYQEHVFRVMTDVVEELGLANKYVVNFVE